MIIYHQMYLQQYGKLLQAEVLIGFKGGLWTADLSFPILPSELPCFYVKLKKVEEIFLEKRQFVLE